MLEMYELVNRLGWTLKMERRMVKRVGVIEENSRLARNVHHEQYRHIGKSFYQLSGRSYSHLMQISVFDSTFVL